MFVKKSMLVLCCLALAGLGYGQGKKPPGKTSPNSKPASKTIANKGTTNTLLWKISGKGLQKPSYLFGTMHLCTDSVKLSENLKKIIHDCDIIYFELDLDDMQEQMGALRYARMNDNKKISDLLTKDEYHKLDSFLKSIKSPLPLSMMNSFKPLFVSSLIEARISNCDATGGMEMQIMAENRKQSSREIKGMETPRYQAGLFDSIPYEKQAKELLNYVDSIDSYRKSGDELIKVYEKQDLNKIDQLITKSDPGLDQYMDLLLYNRSRMWSQQMPTIMAGRSVLFAVGAGHIVGDKGVINLLRKKGYTLTPVAN
jgi:hypothetical protein